MLIDAGARGGTKRASCRLESETLRVLCTSVPICIHGPVPSRVRSYENRRRRNLHTHDQPPAGTEGFLVPQTIRTDRIRREIRRHMDPAQKNFIRVRARGVETTGGFSKLQGRAGVSTRSVDCNVRVDIKVATRVDAASRWFVTNG